MYIYFMFSSQNRSEAGRCQEHTDTMVDLRECLWRVPVALTHMVDMEERSRLSRERCCKVCGLCYTHEISYYPLTGFQFRCVSALCLHSGEEQCQEEGYLQTSEHD